MKKQFVIFTVATGEKWRHLAELLAASIRRFGQYQGDMVAFADGPVSGMVTKNIKDIYEEVMAGQEAVTNIHACRIGGARRLIDAGYERVFYCDADALVVRPLDELLAKVDTGKLVVTADNAWLSGTLATESRWHNGFIRDEEDQQLCRDLRLPTINAGTWLASAGLLRELLHEYYETWKHASYDPQAAPRCREQAALNVWCLRNFDRVEILPHRWIFCNVVGDWVRPARHTRIMHFFHDNISLMDRYYERLLGGEYGLG